MTENAPRPAAPARRPGGRTARTRAQVHDAVVAQLMEHGYDELTVDAVAARAGVHRTTVYRRWRTSADCWRTSSTPRATTPGAHGTRARWKVIWPP